MSEFMCVWVGRLVGEKNIYIMYLSNFLKIPSMLVRECKSICLHKCIAFSHVHFLRQLCVRACIFVRMCVNCWHTRTRQLPVTHVGPNVPGCLANRFMNATSFSTGTEGSTDSP